MNTMNLISHVKELGEFLLIWGFVGVPMTLFAYFDTEWSRYFWIGVVVFYTIILAYSYLFKKTGQDITIDITPRNSEYFNSMAINRIKKNQSHPSKKSQACFFVGSMSGLLSAVTIVSLLEYLFENEIPLAGSFLIIFLILIPGIIGIVLIYLSTKL